MPRRPAGSPPAPTRPDPARPVSVRIAEAAEAATWLGPSDAAAVELAVYLARLIEAAGPDPEAAKAISPLASTLARLLTDLGLTAKGRPTGQDTDEGVTWLDELRERRKTATARGRTSPTNRNA